DVFGPARLAAYFLANFAVRAPLLAALTLLLPGWLVAQPSSGANVSGGRQWVLARRLTIAFGMATAAAAALPSVVIGGGAPPGRGQVVPLFGLVLMLMTLAILHAMQRPRRLHGAGRWFGIVGTVSLLALGPPTVTAQSL